MPRTRNREKGLSSARLDPYLHLAAGVLCDAAERAKRGDVASAFWLMSPPGILMLDALGLNDDIGQQAAGWAIAGILQRAGLRQRRGKQQVGEDWPGLRIGGRGESVDTEELCAR